MICKNKRCMKELHEHYWGDGYCGPDCMHHCMVYGVGERMADRLCDPTDPTGRRVIAETREEIDAMLEAADIDPRLPRIIYLARRRVGLQIMPMVEAAKIDSSLPQIIYLRRCGLTYRKTAIVCHMPESTVRKRLKLCAPKLLIACGLSGK